MLLCQGHVGEVEPFKSIRWLNCEIGSDQCFLVFRCLTCGLYELVGILEIQLAYLRDMVSG